MPSKFNPNKDIPSLAGKVILITGGTAGLGTGSVAELAKHNPAHIFFTGRRQSSADEVIGKANAQSPGVPITFLKCDISSLAAVKTCAATFQAQSPRLDILMLNAGIMAVDADVSADGYEVQFATNHLGRALLVQLLLRTLRATAAETGDARIINMISNAHNLHPANKIDFATLRSPQAGLGGALVPGHTWARYGQSKPAQMLHVDELARRETPCGVTSVSVHPGFVMTGLFDLPFLVKLPALLVSVGQRVPVAEGHYTECWAATVEKGRLRSGEYYVPVGQVGKRNIKVKDPVKLAEELYAWTQREIKPSIQQRRAEGEVLRLFRCFIPEFYLWSMIVLGIIDVLH